MIDFLQRHAAPTLRAALIVYWAALIAALSIPSQAAPTSGMGDKVEHLAAHFVLYCLLYAVLRLYCRSGVLCKNVTITAFIVTLLSGIIGECIQLFLPGRYFEFADMIANGIGALAGIPVMYLLFSRYGAALQKTNSSGGTET